MIPAYARSFTMPGRTRRPGGFAGMVMVERVLIHATRRNGRYAAMTTAGPRLAGQWSRELVRDNGF